MSKLSPFDYLNSINTTKKDLMASPDPEVEKQYVPFVVNRGLSYFQDTVLYANEVNRLSHMTKKMQYHFYLHLIRKRKRFSKWAKREAYADVDVVKEYYGYSQLKAEQVMSLLSKEQIADIKHRTYKGGK